MKTCREIFTIWRFSYSSICSLWYCSSFTHTRLRYRDVCCTLVGSLRYQILISLHIIDLEM